MDQMNQGQTENLSWFSHKQKNWLIGLLSLTAVFSLVLNFSYLDTSRYFASKKMRPNTTEAFSSPGLWGAGCAYAAHMRTQANVAGNNEGYWAWDGVVAECESYGIVIPISHQ